MMNVKMISNLHSQLHTADKLLANVQALGHTVMRRRWVQGFQFGRGEEGVMAVHCQWSLALSVDTEDPQLLVVTGHMGGARGVHMQTIQGGATLCAAISKGFAVFCKEGKTLK